MIRAFACSLLALTTVGFVAPSANPPPDKIAVGVRIGGVKVGGLTAEPARARVRAAFERRVRFVFKQEGKRWSETPQTLGATASPGAAVERALQARPRTRVRLNVKINGERLRRYVATLDRKLSTPAQNATVVGLTNDLRPILSEGEPGHQVNRPKMTRRVVRALHANRRTPIPLAVDVVQPEVTKETYGAVIVLRRESRQIYLYNGENLWRTFPVAVGQPSYPTPLGNWSIATKQLNPWWYPPDSGWAAGAAPIPPGPGNPLGTRWMGLTAPGVGIHATPDAASVGYSASHGCIRMYISDAEWLFDQVEIGTPVFIVAA